MQGSKDTIKNRKFDSIRNTLGAVNLLASVLTIASAGYLIASRENQSLAEIILILAFCLYSLLMLLAMIYVAYTLGHKARYSDATYKIHYGIHYIRDAFNLLQEEGASSKNSFELSLDAMSDAFTLVTGTQCRMQLRLLDATGQNDLILWTYARDISSAEKFKKADKNENMSEESMQRLGQYSPLYRIVHENLPHYMNNDVASSQDFLYKQVQGNGDDFKSLLVVPIRCKPLDGETNNLDNVIGFLELKSNHRKVFQLSELDLLKAFADAFYPALELAREIKEDQ